MPVAHITTREHGDTLVWAAARDHGDVQGLCRTGPVLHWLWHSRELAPPLTSGSIQESQPCAWPGQHSGAGCGGRGVSELGPVGVSMGALAPPLVYSGAVWV